MVENSMGLARCWVVKERRGSGGVGIWVWDGEELQGVLSICHSVIGTDLFQCSKNWCSHAPARDRGGGGPPPLCSSEPLGGLVKNLRVPGFHLKTADYDSQGPRLRPLY